MEPLHIDGNATTPTIHFDALTHVMEMSGYSRPENVRDFYDHVLQWVNDYCTMLERLREEGKELSPTILKLRFKYFNSSSAKFICDVILLFREMFLKGFEVEVMWFYEAYDTEMLEVGSDLSDMVDFEFSYHPY